MLSSDYLNTYIITAADFKFSNLTGTDDKDTDDHPRGEADKDT